MKAGGVGERKREGGGLDVSEVKKEQIYYRQ